MTSSTKRAVIRGLYLITDARQDDADLLSAIEAAITGGAHVVQYRDKSASAVQQKRRAAALRALCHERGITFIVNDDVDLAHSVAADGVHLGDADPPLAAARRRLGNDAIIGVSCYNSLARAQVAAAAGATYVAFGSFFPSPTKPTAVRAAPALLTAARRQLSLPIVAIGGITPENGAPLVRAGADALAVISGVLAQSDTKQAAQRYAALFN